MYSRCLALNFSGLHVLVLSEDEHFVLQLLTKLQRDSEQNEHFAQPRNRRFSLTKLHWKKELMKEMYFDNLIHGSHLINVESISTVMIFSVRMINSAN
jgi:hypothetical protein